jgi:hypothetical protein
MKVKATKTYTHQGKLVSAGDVFDSEIGEELIRNGLAVPAGEKTPEVESKPKRKKAQ